MWVVECTSIFIVSLELGRMRRRNSWKSQHQRKDDCSSYITPNTTTPPAISVYPMRRLIELLETKRRLSIKNHVHRPQRLLDTWSCHLLDVLMGEIEGKRNGRDWNGHGGLEASNSVAVSGPRGMRGYKQCYQRTWNWMLRVARN